MPRLADPPADAVHRRKLQSEILANVSRLRCDSSRSFWQARLPFLVCNNRCADTHTRRPIAKASSLASCSLNRVQETAKVVRASSSAGDAKSELSGNSGNTNNSNSSNNSSSSSERGRALSEYTAGSPFIGFELPATRLQAQRCLHARCKDKTLGLTLLDSSAFVIARWIFDQV